jgi:hypothetical protein
MCLKHLHEDPSTDRCNYGQMVGHYLWLAESSFCHPLCRCSVCQGHDAAASRP